MVTLLTIALLAAPPPPPPPPPDAGADLSDEEFAKTFGRPRKRKGEKEPAKSTAYVPPPPGAGAPPPVLERLEPQHVKDVVLAARPDLQRCADGQPNLAKGKTTLTLKWAIGLDGKVGKVELVGDELKGTHLAGCITKLVKRWQFPKHAVASEPVVFPFRF